MATSQLSKSKKERPFKCVVRGCKLDLRAHGRMADYLEQTEGPRSANAFESRHRDRNTQDE